MEETFAKTISGGLLARFLRYVKIGTTSNPENEATPSTPGQWTLARLLEGELREAGLSPVVTDHCYVCAALPPSPGCEGVPAIAFLAHLDTANEVSGEGVNPRVQETALEGKPDTVITGDGTTLLGADDKAGIAEIMSAVSYLCAHSEIRHGRVEIFFTPDEETGKGLPCFPLEKLGAKVCYTVDGNGLGEFEAECFNAYSAAVTFEGKAIHPGSARGVLVNAALMAANYAVLLPRNESPEAADGRYGFYFVTKIEAAGEKARLELLLRDFEGEVIERRLAALDAFARAVEAQFPGGKVSVEKKRTYSNMREKIAQTPAALEKLRSAAKAASVPFTLKPVRGGTDGSRLTELGYPTPNIFTGSHDIHSRAEWASLNEMAAATLVLVCLVKEWARGG